MQSVAIQPGSPTDAILTRGLTLIALSGTDGAPVTGYQYGWRRADCDQTGPHEVPDVALLKACRLSYVVTSPASDWTLLARAQDSDREYSPWMGISVVTPGAPELVALGTQLPLDTMRHRRYLERPAKTRTTDIQKRCSHKRWRKSLPSAWRENEDVALLQLCVLGI